MLSQGRLLEELLERSWGQFSRKMLFLSSAYHSSNLGDEELNWDQGLGHAAVEAGLLRPAGGRFCLVTFTIISSDTLMNTYKGMFIKFPLGGLDNFTCDS